jgi:glucose/arabinose dehydrogenase
MYARARTLALLALAVAAAFPAAAHAAVRATEVATFTEPVAVAAPPDDPHRIFVLEKAGLVRVVRDGVELPDAFLDIQADVVSGGEMGLLSLAFAPDYAASGKLYLYYTTPSPRPGDSGNDVVIEEVTRSADPDRGDPATRRRVLTIPHPTNTNHNGGQLMFGRDGYLWITTGDGGSGNDPPNNAQNLDVLLGKVLRIDARGGTPYAIPPDNPFAAAGDGARDEIWAFGLRNPFRASFDRATGDLTIGDVGQNRAEEVDFAPADGGAGAEANYGWSCFEGLEPNPSGSGPCKPNPVEPVIEQVQATSGFCAIIGGFVVRDPALADLAGRYVYGDNCQAGLRSAVLALPRATDDRPVGLRIAGLSSFGEDSCGHVYAASLAGPVYRLDGDVPPAPCPEPAAPGTSEPATPGTTAGADTTAPVVRLSRGRLQRAVRRHGFVIAVRCGEDCGFAATARLRIRGDRRVYVLRDVSGFAAAGRRKRVKLRTSGPAAAALRGALARRRPATASFLVVAHDAAGNEARVRKSARARR